MKNHSARQSYYVVDPGCLTPAYDTELCVALAQAGHDVTLVTAPYRNDSSYRFPESIRMEPLFFRHIGLEKFPRLRRLVKGLQYARYYRDFLRFLRGKQVDAVHFQWLLVPPIDHFFIRRLKKQHPGAPVVVTIHDVQPLFKLVGGRYVTKILQAVDGVVVHGETARKQLLESMPDLDPEKVRVIPHGPLHMEAGDGVVQSRSEARAALGLSQERHVGLFFGEIKEYKGLDVLVNALAGLSELDRERLTFVVAGKVEEQSCLAHLRQLERLPLDLQMHLNYIPTQLVPSYFQAADFVVLPYKSITQSGILFTALSNGCAVIASDVGELGDVIQKTQSGWVFPPNDELSLRNLIRHVLRAEKKQLNQVGEQGRLALHQQFGWEQIAAKTIQMYQSRRRSQEDSRELQVRQRGC